MIAAAAALAVLNSWIERHPSYTYTVNAMELGSDGKPVEATLRVTFDAQGHMETMHVVSGHMAGTDLTYTGGESVDVRGPGLAHFLSIKMPLRDPRILSPQGNDARTGMLASAARCFTSDAAHLQAADEQGVLTLTDESPTCTDGYGSAPVTVDRLTLDADGEPLERERYQGQTLLERWTISDLQ